MKRILAIFALLVLGIGSHRAVAATGVRASIAVGVTVAYPCVASASPMSLATVLASRAQVQPSVSVECASPTPYTVSVVQGPLAVGRIAPQMAATHCAAIRECAAAGSAKMIYVTKQTNGWSEINRFTSITGGVTSDYVTVAVEY